MAKFIHLAPEVEEERRMSFKVYDYYRLHGYSPEQAVILASNGQDTPEMYEQKNAVDNANSGELRNVIGLKDEYKGDAMNNEQFIDEMKQQEKGLHINIFGMQTSVGTLKFVERAAINPSCTFDILTDGTSFFVLDDGSEEIAYHPYTSLEDARNREDTSAGKLAMELRNALKSTPNRFENEG